MCSVQGGVQLVRDVAGLVASPVTFITNKVVDSRSVLMDEDSEDSSDSDDENTTEKKMVPLAKTCVPQTLNFEAPMDAAPGKPVCLAGPHGPIMIPLPDDVQPGKPCSIRLGPQEHYTIPVPEGVAPGGMIEFKGMGGEMLHALCPPGMKAGDEFRVTPPVILVQVPPGVKAGQQVAYISPLGQQLFAQVPAGLQPGHYFSALYEVATNPAPPAPPAQQMEGYAAKEPAAAPVAVTEEPRKEEEADVKPASEATSAPAATESLPTVDEKVEKTAEADKTAADSEKCAECGVVFGGTQKFCGECGAKRPAK